MKINQAGLAEAARYILERRSDLAGFRVSTPGDAVVIWAGDTSDVSVAITHCEMAVEGFDRETLIYLLNAKLAEIRRRVQGRTR